MRYAVLDIGTNTVKLLVADYDGGELKPLLEHSETTRIGQGVAGNGRLLPEAVERTVEVVGHFADEARKLGAQRFLGFATSAVRDASNREEFRRAFHARTGFDCEVISGNREAGMIFIGATSQAEWREREVIVFDIGGGSIEFIRGRRGTIDFKVSLDCGAVRVTELFLKSDPPSRSELAALDGHVRALLQSPDPPIPRPLEPMPLLGTGGTISCLASVALKCPLPDPARIDGHRLTLDRLIELLDHLASMPLAQRRQVRGLPPKRADIIVAGAAILVAGVEFLGQSEITVSARNLRHGAVLQLARETTAA
jgi:exopolyphosphatase/guanosine-5'-triphosphate,3'-diphosphate pyrophosphatase